MKKLLIIISLSFITACGGGGSSSSGVQGLNVPGNISMVPAN
tara:strand:+ start:148 stop:273 length:126 start_codon:yes stop_codon:yes gene_type:complete